MRRLAKRIRATAQRHIALTLAFIIAFAVISGGVSLAALSGTFNPAAPVANTYTFSADWTLLDLERHVQAGEVATISLVAGTPSAGSVTQTDVLAARTTSGQWVRVNLAVSPSDALVALRSLGYGRLIATDSVAQLPAGYGTSCSGSGSSDPDAGDSVQVSWDLNGDGVFGDASGAKPTVAWGQVEALVCGGDAAGVAERIGIDAFLGPHSLKLGEIFNEH